VKLWIASAVIIACIVIWVSFATPASAHVGAVWEGWHPTRYDSKYMIVRVKHVPNATLCDYEPYDRYDFRSVAIDLPWYGCN
jgi:hypothetical protein